MEMVIWLLSVLAHLGLCHRHGDNAAGCLAYLGLCHGHDDKAAECISTSMCVS